jgi:riboflavin transporter FmnP
MKAARSYRVAVVIVFAALTLILNLSPLKFPAPYAPFLYYQFWEIPIVAAFLIYGFKVGVSIALINTLILLLVFPGANPTGPFYNLVAIVSMLTGMWLTLDISRRMGISGRRQLIILVIALGIVFRVAIMSIVNYLCLQQPPPIGFALPVYIVIAYLPLVAIFNSSLAAYTIPLGFILASSVSRIGSISMRMIGS